MKKLFLLFIVFFTLFFSSFTNAFSAGDYEINSFDADIRIEKDTSITVTEKIEVDFLIPKHGIFREIPEKGLKVISVTDESGGRYPYEVSGLATKTIKIGDPDKTITGEHVYIIAYKVPKEIRHFEDHGELYWNVTGDEWDTQIKRASVKVSSPFAAINSINCFSGVVGSTDKNCKGSFDQGAAEFFATAPVGLDSDFTIVIGLQTGSLAFPSALSNFLDWVLAHWPLFLTPLPFLITFYLWFKKGRDLRYVSENIYFEPQDTKIRTTALFERKHLPLVYYPIQGLTPSQVGTIIDEKVDIADVTAEIVEMARLGYMTIKKTPSDYEFIAKKEDTKELTNYQKYLFESLFLLDKKVLLSELKNSFYLKLPEFKKELYENMAKDNFFEGNPEKTRQKWFVILIFSGILGFVFLNIYLSATGDFWPLVAFVFFEILSFLTARAMPRRTPKGYQLFRQIEGLKWYLNKGKWRYEIAEKHLFLEEVLPLAISLGVVKKLTKQAQVLGIAPPSYVSGVATSSFASDFSGFESKAGKTLASSPGGSGGSGFSGGSSGGGGGGGGGGSW